MIYFNKKRKKMQFHILKQVEERVANVNGKVIFVGRDLFLASYPTQSGRDFLVQKAKVNDETGGIDIITIFNEQLCDSALLVKMITLIDNREDNKDTGKGFSVNSYTEAELVQMEFIDNEIEFNDEMVQMALSELSQIDGLTVAESVSEVASEINYRKSKEKAL